MLDIYMPLEYNEYRLFKPHAVVAELADALASGASPGYWVGVQVPSAALEPKTCGCNATGFCLTPNASDYIFKEKGV